MIPPSGFEGQSLFHAFSRASAGLNVKRHDFRVKISISYMLYFPKKITNGLAVRQK